MECGEPTHPQLLWVLNETSLGGVAFLSLPMGEQQWVAQRIRNNILILQHLEIEYLYNFVSVTKLYYTSCALVACWYPETARTCECSGNPFMRIMVKRLEVMFVGDTDVSHPVTQGKGRFVVDSIVDELAWCGHVSGPLADEEFMGCRRLRHDTPPISGIPRVLRPMERSPGEWELWF